MPSAAKALLRLASVAARLKPCPDVPKVAPLRRLRTLTARKKRRPAPVGLTDEEKAAGLRGLRSALQGLVYYRRRGSCRLP